MTKKERIIREFGWIWRNLFVGVLIYYVMTWFRWGQTWKGIWILEATSGLKTGAKNDMFWPELRPGLVEAGGTPPPRIPRSTPLGLKFNAVTLFQCSILTTWLLSCAVYNRDSKYRLFLIYYFLSSPQSTILWRRPHEDLQHYLARNGCGWISKKDWSQFSEPYKKALQGKSHWKTGLSKGRSHRRQET